MKLTMTPKHLFVLLLALFAIALAQNDDEFHIPVENDNQFPPDNPDVDRTEVQGSGAGEIEEPLDGTTEPEGPAVPLIEDVTLLKENVPTVAAEEHVCPEPCVCNVEGDTNKYIVDCTGYQLTELPKPLDPKTTDLKLQNNKLTEIPKEISDLKNLKTLNVDNNEIMKIVSGSISELPELVSLKLGNNRLLEFPQDLKNSFGLTKLEELDLGGNDMRTDLTPESFTNFKALRSITLPDTAASLVEDLCTSFKESLITVCTGSCDLKTFECPDALLPHGLEDELLNNATLPAVIPIEPDSEDDIDPTINSSPDLPVGNDAQENKEVSTANVETTETATLTNDETKKSENISFRNSIIKAPQESNSEPEIPKEKDSESTNTSTTKPESEVVGANTAGTKTGGVDKSIIGMIVAGMVLVVAGITIKKNWSSIKKRFSSTPRNANERTSVNANGTAPEEVPLQEKSPV